MQVQDWTPVVFTKTKPVGTRTIEKKIKKTELKSGVKVDEDGEIKIKTVPREIATLITQARIAKKLTRKQLANNLNLKEDVIADIETFKAIYDGNLIAKIKKHLNII
jgi:ribosome-binding protein aMBF1 (putative translation factor)